jgi:hypothetical protein
MGAIAPKRHEMSNYLIIGIHGLNDKPSKSNLTELWIEAIMDGLGRNEGRTSSEPPAFELVHWADVVHGPDRLPDWHYPQWPKEGRFPSYADGFWDALRERAQDFVDTPLDAAKRWLGADPVSDIVLQHTLQDLGRYYDESAVRDQLRARLRAALESAHTAGKRIMILGHSMGSIIAYDALREIGRERRDIAVDHLVTLGSPLGLPSVKFRIWQENDLVRTPSIVRKWTNLAERRDPVAFDTHLAGDYRANDYGVAVHDDLVCNDTVPQRDSDKADEIDYHSAFGYLRTPELSRVIRGFL